MHGDRVHVQNVGLNSNTRRGSECMETEFMDINLHNLSEIYYLIFLVTTFHCRYCKFCGISFKSKKELRRSYGNMDTEIMPYLKNFK